MSLKRSDVERVAHLARLEVAESDIAEYARNLSNILGLMVQLEAVDTQGVKPMAHPLDAVQRLRADVVTETDQREQFQSIAPKVAEGLYLVPKVLE
ncbi:MAG: Asp-tRNA(Asn)/Glu-tRNA(Gln) amidotransferase subunit GatC [Pseudomonadota bacterium]|nr:Asp-tRNA(Asn)/Glu-tRNA(Gln) amidotransferase subunit GatC [Pseudomonadota bacterium]